MAPLPDLSHDERMKLAAQGEAMPDGSYPTPDCSYLKHAVQAYGRETGDRAALRRYLTRRAVHLGCPGHLPDDWKIEARHAA